MIIEYWANRNRSCENGRARRIISFNVNSSTTYNTWHIFILKQVVCGDIPLPFKAHPEIIRSGKLIIVTVVSTPKIAVTP
jgi:hypothetical protein